MRALPHREHGRDDARPQWDKAADELSATGFPVHPEQPEPIETDPIKRGKVRESRIQTLSTCDALLLLAPEDPAIFSEELMVLGKADRGLAIDRAQQHFGQRGKKLPGAIIDQITDPNRIKRRRDQARNVRLEWLSFNDPNWVNNTEGWLRGSLK